MKKIPKHIFDSDAEYQEHIKKIEALEKYLDAGDLQLIAETHNVTYQYVSNIKRGTGRNNKILNAIIQIAKQNKDFQTQTI